MEPVPRSPCRRHTYGSSEEFVGGYGLRQFAKRVIEGQFEDAIGSEAIRFSHSDFGLIVETLDDPAGKHLLSAKIVQDEVSASAPSKIDPPLLTKSDPA